MNGTVATEHRLSDRLSAIVAATLRVPVACVGPSDTFTSLGMDSLAAVELTAAIEDELELELPLTAVHEYPDVDSLRRFLEDGSADSRARRHERLLADAVLPREIAPGGGAPVPTRDARHVLLTGATGFLGAHLLRALLDETTATIHCLVRPDTVEGLTRVRRNLDAYGLWSDAGANRVRIIDGDLDQPMFGREAHAFHDLAGEIDAIYHAAANVNWVRTYETLRDTNVAGTRELLRLACDGTPKPFHFVSSTSVCHSTTGPRVVDERADVFAGVDGLWRGYAQSKCVAEALVREAGGRGLPVTIIRPSLISGDGRRGRSNVDDLTSRFIAGCIRMHAAPDLDWRMDCVPVDDAARAIVRLALAHESGVGVSHVTAAQPRHWRECVLWMRLRGYDVDLLPYAEWADVLRATEGASHPLHGLRSFFLHPIAAESHLTLPELFEESRRSSVNGTRTRRALAALGVTVHAVDSRLLSRYFDDFVRRGVVPDAGHRPTARHSDGAAHPLLEPSDSLATGLGEWLGVVSARVEQISMSRMVSEESIVAELTAEPGDGLFDAVVSLSDATGTRREARLFVKAKSADTRAIEVAVALATLASGRLGDTVARFRNDLGLTGSHHRELAIYGMADPRLREYTPRPVLIERDDARRRWLLALESIDDAALINATDTARWDDASIDAALSGLASIHSAWLGRAAAVAAEPWLAPRRDMAKRVEMTPLWAALAEHAHERSAAWGDHRVRRIHEGLVADVASWASVLDAAPRTLIHNDFNPRNVALRRAAGRLKLCAFDWELATLGAPQRDLAEFLAFVLPPGASVATVAGWVERSRSLLAAAAGVALPRADWEAGFSAALCDVLVDRLASYAMIDRVRPQHFLPRVVRSWLTLFRHFPWTG